MKPRLIHPEQFRAELTDRTQRTFIVRRPVYRVTVGTDYALQDENGFLWRPVADSFDSDGSSVPHPIDWLAPAFDILRYRKVSMAIHDPACRTGFLNAMIPGSGGEWRRVPVTRKEADNLLFQGILALRGWRVTAWGYWLGVRAGAGLDVLKERVLSASDRIR